MTDADATAYSNRLQFARGAARIERGEIRGFANLPRRLGFASLNRATR
jgi:hypothetical protein